MRLEGSDLENPPLRLPLELVDEGGDSIGGSLNPLFTLYSSGVRATDGNLLKQNYGLNAQLAISIGSVILGILCLKSGCNGLIDE